MKKKTEVKKRPLPFVPIMLVVTLLALLALQLNQRPAYKDYDNYDALSAPNPPAPSRNATNYIGGDITSDTLLSAGRLDISGVQTLLSVSVKQDTIATLECSYSSLKGAFKVFLVSEEGKAALLYDSDAQPSGAAVDVPFRAGENQLRLAGKPAYIKDLVLGWTQLDRTGMR